MNLSRLDYSGFTSSEAEDPEMPDSDSDSDSDSNSYGSDHEDDAEEKKFDTTVDNILSGEGKLKFIAESSSRNSPSSVAEVNIEYYYDEDSVAFDDSNPLFRVSADTSFSLINHDDEYRRLSVADVAQRYIELGRPRDAEQVYQRFLDKQRAALGDDHPSTFESMQALAGFYEDQKRYGVAARLYMLTLENRLRVLGENHRDTIDSRFRVSALYLRQKRLLDAAPGLEDSVHRSKSVVGERDKLYLDALYSLGLLRVAQELYFDAEDCFKQCHRRRAQVLGAQHPETLEVLQAMNALQEKKASAVKINETDITSTLLAPLTMAYFGFKYLFEWGEGR